MNLELNKKQFRRLLDMVYIGNWILNSARGQDRFSDYDEVESLLFSKSKRVVLNKKKGGFAIRSWSDDSFTFYPFQAGTPYYFEKLSGTGGKEEHAVQEVKPIQDDCLECESKDCAYNRDGICRFSKVFDRGPSITEEDGCTEFVIRHTY